jgi:hypothetical protein
MGGLMEPLLNIAAKQAAEKAAAEATEESKKNTLIANIRSLMKKLNLTAQQAMDILEVPANEQGKYLTHLKF